MPGPVPDGAVRDAPRPPDILSCEREAIQLPGSIQPHGMILIADAATLTIGAGAGDIEASLSPRWLGAHLDDMLGQSVATQIEARPGQATIALARVDGIDTVFDAIAHRSAGSIIVELEPAPATMPSAIEMLSAMEEAAAAFEQAFGLHDLCERAAETFRRLTGFDRVMVYRFLDDDAGVVVAEDRDPAQRTFLNQHFPASDIPRQARALYVRNRVRVIPDIAYAPAPLRPAGGPPLDMSDLALRSVSPVHLEYLANMGVAASASVSIVRDGALWGLIACHNATPKRLPLHLRMACRALAGSLARQIRAKEDAELYRERIRLRTAEDAVILRLGSDTALSPFFATVGDDVRRMLGADGFAAVRGGELFVAGRAPGHEDIRMIAAHVADLTRTLPFSTDRLSDHLAGAAACQGLASGVLAVTMPTDEPTILVWLRAEQVEVVNWAGNPHKHVPLDPHRPLSPRASFESWSEAVRGRSVAWTVHEVEAAGRLARTLFDARQHRRLSEVNHELTATIADNESLLMQKDYLIKEVHHRVQNSLQLVSAFLGMQGREVGNAVVTEHLAEAQRRLSAVAMVHRRLHSDEHLQAIDLARYIGDLCTEIKSTMDPAWGEQIQLDLAPVLMRTDRAVHIGLILTELVINANKYAYAGGAGPITIALEQQRTRFSLIVSDRGGGKSGRSSGFGSRMLVSLVARLAGTIEESDNRPGLRVTIVAPISEA
ncbi:histidine kinase dimerization/phosphoacceptor domain -containing protein [Sphingomonas faeni]|uniref:histidine kinase dimerization/phosphoacceptor domain -containing protein n=1 Tax=Sphingomonas faeni TaxID=185950 RepID=UPI0020C7AC64|nr:histidine kinase dimerization/phosphoacceptor domain -containing protein [Sphingomonas faeni]MCP8890678.1 GAF domain-containing protein [Sphingomonas faeni]